VSQYYAGIGSRSTPPDVGRYLSASCAFLAHSGFILRSGGAVGADSYCQQGAGNGCQIFLSADATSAAIELASAHHPCWYNCNIYARQFHGRNAMILLGADLATPVDFVLCWTPSGRLVGGTAMGIRIARRLEIPVYNIAKRVDLLAFEERCRDELL
jgi:hypothetical protein